MGVCFDCLVEVDGVASVQSCQTPVHEGMRVRRQQGCRELPA
jgi:predicted molibdopterin-dependent oxidoreductase YjgC